MKKIYLFLSTSLFLLLGGITSCDDNSLSHDEVNIPDPVVISDEDDGISPEPTTESVIRIQPENKHQEIDGFGCNFGWAEAVYGCMKREQIMDDLYGENGLRFNIYRGEVCASSASEDGKTFNFKTGENYHWEHIQLNRKHSLIRIAENTRNIPSCGLSTTCVRES